MDYDITKQNGETVCRLKSDLTFKDQEAFQEMLESAVTQADGTIVLDMQDVEFIDSSGMGMLLIAQERADDESWTFRVDKPAGQVRKMLELAQLEQVITISG